MELEQAGGGPVAGKEWQLDFKVSNQSALPAFQIGLDFKIDGPGRLVRMNLDRGECEETTCRISSFDGKESVSGYVVVVPETGFDRNLRVDADVSWELTDVRRRHNYREATGEVADGGRPGDLIWLTAVEASGGSCGARVQVGPDTVYAGFAKKLYAVSRENGEVIWVAQSDNTMFHPYLAGGSIYLHTIKRQKPRPDLGYIRSLNAVTGELNWEHEIEGQIRGPGVLYGGNVFYVANIQSGGSILWQYHLLALDASTGKPKWSYPVKGNINTPAMEFEGSIYFASYAGGPDFLYSIDPHSGELIRQYRLRGGAYTTPLVTEGMIYTVSGDGHLRSFDLSKGRENWVYKPDARASRTPVLSNGSVVSLIYYPEESEFLAVEGIDAATGQLSWNYRTGEPLTQPTASDGSIYVPTKSKLVSLEAKTGSINWEGDYPGQCSLPAAADGVLFGRAIIDNDFYIYAIRGD